MDINNFDQIFLDDNFDEKKLAADIIQAQNISLFISTITQRINEINQKIHAHIIEKHQDLLSYAAGIEKLHGVVQTIANHIQTLLSYTKKIRQRIYAPYQHLSASLLQLENLQSTCDMLRKIIRVESLIKRLNDQAKEPVKASASLNELVYLFDSFGEEWRGIHVLETHHERMRDAEIRVKHEALRMFREATDTTKITTTTNQTSLSQALQIFDNLNCLDKVLREMIETWQREFTETLKDYLCPDKIAQKSSSGVSTGAANATSSLVGASDLAHHHHPQQQQQQHTSSGSIGPGRANWISASTHNSQSASFRTVFWSNLDKLVNGGPLELELVRFSLLKRTLLAKKAANPTAPPKLPKTARMTSQPHDVEELDEPNLLDELENRARAALMTSDKAEHRSHVVSRCVAAWLELFKRDGAFEHSYVRWVVEQIRAAVCGATTTTTLETASSTLLKQTLEGEYPKLLRLFQEFRHKIYVAGIYLSDEQPPSSSSVADDSLKAWRRRNREAACQQHDEEEQFEEAQREEPLDCPLDKLLRPFEQSYLNRSLSRLFDPVELTFGSVSASVTSSSSVAASCSSSSLSAAAGGGGAAGSGGTVALAGGSGGGGGTSSFSGGTSSGALDTQIEAHIRAVNNELTFVLGHDQLLLHICRQIAKQARLIFTHVEQCVVAGGPEAVQIKGPQNATQQRNCALYQFVQRYCAAMQQQVVLRLDSQHTHAHTHTNTHSSTMIGQNSGIDVGGGGAAMIRAALAESHRVESLCYEALFERIGGALLNIVDAMHREPGLLLQPQQQQQNQHSQSATTVAQHPAKCSPYMHELSAFCTRIHNQYVAGFGMTRCNLIGALRPQWSRVIRRFIESVCVLPAGSLCAPAARLQLALDCDQLLPALSGLLGAAKEVSSVPSSASSSASSSLSAGPASSNSPLGELLSDPSLSAQLFSLRDLLAAKPSSSSQSSPSQLLLASSWQAAPPPPSSSGSSSSNARTPHCDWLGPARRLHLMWPYSMRLIGALGDLLRQPHVAAGWSLDKYVAWLCEPDRTQLDRLEFIRGTLDAYAHKVNAMGQKEYDPIYIDMNKFLNSSRKNVNSASKANGKEKNEADELMTRHDEFAH